MLEIRNGVSFTTTFFTFFLFLLDQQIKCVQYFFLPFNGVAGAILLTPFLINSFVKSFKKKKYNEEMKIKKIEGMAGY